MRDFKIVLAQHQIAEEQNIQVERPRPIPEPPKPPKPRCPVAAKLALQIEQRVEQLARSQIRFKPDNRIEKPRLIGVANRRGGVERRTRGQAANLRQPRYCRGQCSLRQPGRAGQVGAESDVGNGHAILPIAPA